MEDKKLVELACKIKEKSYSPYSNFRVGAAILTESGKVFTGVNIENVSYGATICAERTAIFKAVSEGESKINKIAIASDSEEYILPCGICRQVLAEFGNEYMRILCSKKDGDFKEFSLGDLLPNAFKKSGGDW